MSATTKTDHLLAIKLARVKRWEQKGETSKLASELRDLMIVQVAYDRALNAMADRQSLVDVANRINTDVRAIRAEQGVAPEDDERPEAG